VLRELAVLLGAFRPPGEPMRRIGVLMYLAADDAEGQARLAAFAQALKQLGWSDGRNLRIDTRWANADDIRKHAAELAALAPDVLLAATGTATVAPLLQATRTVPIVFVSVIDPVGAGFVASLLNLSPDLYACVENELFGSLGQPCDASCPWTWRAQRVRVEYPLGGHSIAR
jgi:ABC transporter substrate binding protein